MVWFDTSLFCGLFLSIGTYWLGESLRKKTGKTLFHPLLVACILVILFLVVTGTPYKSYQASTKLLSDLLTPATVCLAIPLYRQFQVLRDHLLAILAGVLSGVLTTFLCVLGVALLFQLTHAQYVTLLPKSVTTAIGMVLAEEAGGIAPITVTAILVTGIWGNITAPLVCRLLHIYNPVAKGVAIGASCHVIGTTRALEMGEVEGAMSGLSTVISGLLTVFAIPVITALY